MTKDQFIAYAHEYLSPSGLEGLFEMIDEFNGEVARFGDGGPGSLLRLRAEIMKVHRIERQLARLEGREPRKDFGFRVRMPS